MSGRAHAGIELGIQQTNIMVGVPGTDYVGPRLPEQAVSVEPRNDDGVERTGGCAGNDHVHDLARGRAARPQDLRGAGGALTLARLGHARINSTKHDNRGSSALGWSGADGPLPAALLCQLNEPVRECRRDARVTQFRIAGSAARSA